MSLHMTGECLGVSRVNRGPEGNTFEVTSIHLVDRSNGVHTHEIALVRDFQGALPEAGDFVVLDVFIAKWTSKTTGNSGYDLKATRRNSQLEAAMLAPAGK